MSKILFTLAFAHPAGEGKEKVSRMPQLVISTNNLYGIHVTGKDFAHPKFKNANIEKDLKPWKNRFEYAVTGGRNVTRLSLVVNTSAVLPHLTWSTGGPIKIPAMGMKSERRQGSRRNENNRRSEDSRTRRDSRQPVASIEDRKRPQRYEDDERRPGGYIEDRRRPLRYEDDDRRPGGYIEDRKRPIRYDDDQRRPQRYQNEKRRPGGYIEDRKRPIRYDDDQRRPQRYEDEKRRPGKYDGDDDREYRRARRRANRINAVDDGNVEGAPDGGDADDGDADGGDAGD